MAGIIYVCVCVVFKQRYRCSTIVYLSSFYKLSSWTGQFKRQHNRFALLCIHRGYVTGFTTFLRTYEELKVEWLILTFFFSLN